MGHDNTNYAFTWCGALKFAIIELYEQNTESYLIRLSAYFIKGRNPCL